jgi:hypothetical protein
VSKFEHPEAWAALEREDAAFWAGRGPAQRAAAVLGLTSELMRVARQQDPAPVAAADAIRRDEKLREWVGLKERLRCQNRNHSSSKVSSDAP